MQLSQFAILAFLLTIAVISTGCTMAQSPSSSAGPAPMPRLIQKAGRHALLVDDAPYLILGAQVGNSSAWPAMLTKVWPAMRYMHVNTVEIPIYWEQFEPVEGQFDYTVLDTILKEARQHGLRLVLLWFGTWKNGSAHYVPPWIKLAPQRYPNMIGPDGKEVDSPSPFATQTMQADIRAFTAFMRHLKQADPQRTVLMVQVENEPGSWQCVRDFSPAAQEAFEHHVPPEILAAMDKPSAAPAPNWKQAFGDNADEYFNAWSVAHYIQQVAAAGKAEYPLPLVVNAALRDPLKPEARPPGYESGGPTDNVLPIWKAAAPDIDILAPDIYQRDSVRYLKVLELYGRPDNPLFVPETGGDATTARFLFVALNHGAIGFAPFGMDYTRTTFGSPASTGTPMTAEQYLAPWAATYQLIGPMSREIARLNFEGKLQAAVEVEGEAAQTLHFPRWEATVAYSAGRTFGPSTRPVEPHPPTGRILIAQLGDDEFLVTGISSRVNFKPIGAIAGKPWQYLRVEEVRYESGKPEFVRIWNGDQTDWGLNFFSTSPQILRVHLYTR